MNGQNDIPRAEIPNVSVTDPEEIEELKLELIKNPDLYRVNNYRDAKFTIDSLEAAMDKKRPFGKRVASFIAGQSKLSRGIGSALDFMTLFIPFGKQINTGRDALRLILGRKQKQKEITMSILKDKPWYQSKTIWAAILVVLTTVLQALDVSFVQDPETMQSIYQVIYVLAGSFGLYGLRDAVGKKLDDSKK